MPAPTPGAVVDGYRFRGGNPNDPNSWEQEGPVAAQGAWAQQFPGALQMPDGSIVRPGPRGGMQVLSKGGSDLTVNDRSLGSADQRGRVTFSLDPMIRSMQTTDRYEQQFGNVMRNAAPAAVLDQWASAAEDGGPLRRIAASAIGGPGYNEYTSALSAFEAGVLPIFSGSAVTVSEAQRFIRANMPTPQDTPDVARQKAERRKMITNAAARVVGAELPYPDVPTWLPQAPQARAEAESLLGGRPPAPAPEAPAAPPRRGQASGQQVQRTQRAMTAGQYDSKAQLGTRQRPFVAESMDVVQRLAADPRNRGKVIVLPDGSMQEFY